MTSPGVAVVGVAARATSLKKSNGCESPKPGDHQCLAKVTAGQATSAFANARHAGLGIGKQPRKFPGETDAKTKSYQAQPDYKDAANHHHQDYKAIALRFAGQASSVNRENHAGSATLGTGGGVHQSRNDNTAFAVARKALEQQNPAAKMAPINFPPLRAPQSIVNVRHPFVTEARTKHSDAGAAGKSKLALKELELGRQPFHGYGAASQIGIPSVTANISYPRPPDSFAQPPTVASVLFPETAQFPQSPPFGTTQLGQLNQLNHQYQTYDPGSFATTPVSVNPVIPQYSDSSLASSIAYPQYENAAQFVQTNHYPAADIANSQYQYQGVGQIQDSPVFIQSLQSPIAVADQYAAPNYARAVRTELVPRLRRPPRFNK